MVRLLLLLLLSLDELLDLLDLGAQLFLLLGREGRLEVEELANALGILVLDERGDVLRSDLEQPLDVEVVRRQHQGEQGVVRHATDKGLIPAGGRSCVSDDDDE